MLTNKLRNIKIYPMFLGTPADVDAEVRKIIEETRGKGLILSSGCALSGNTRPENVRAMVEAAKKYGTREQLEALQE